MQNDHWKIIGDQLLTKCLIELNDTSIRGEVLEKTTTLCNVTACSAQTELYCKREASSSLQ